MAIPSRSNCVKTANNDTEGFVEFDGFILDSGEIWRYFDARHAVINEFSSNLKVKDDKTLLSLVVYTSQLFSFFF